MMWGGGGTKFVTSKKGPIKTDVWMCVDRLQDLDYPCDSRRKKEIKKIIDINERRSRIRLVVQC